jgi:predicted transcriptional regulator
LVRKLTPPIVAKIHALQRTGLNQVQIASKLGIAQATVHNGLKETDPNAGKAAKRSSKRLPPLKKSKTPETMDDLRTLVAEHVRALQDLANDAKRRENTSVYLQLAKASMALVKELARLTPPERGDEDDAPDMVEAARRAREKILERVRRRARGAA